MFYTLKIYIIGNIKVIDTLIGVQLRIKTGNNHKALKRFHINKLISLINLLFLITTEAQ